MTVRVFLIDAFATAPFAGNPAAVCLLPEESDGGWMAAFARELNQPATAFTWEADGDRHVRWFSPASELALCGHGTLATAHVLWETGTVGADAAVRFPLSAAGPLGCALLDGWITMDFPAERAEPADAPPTLLDALGTRPQGVWRNRLDYLVLLGSETAVRAARPNSRLLATVPTRGTIVTAPADDPGIDFVSRFFAPAFGIDEDAVTGSAHCALGPFWGERLAKDDLVGFQASTRGGIVRTRPNGERVELLGRAVTILHGEMLA